MMEVLALDKAFTLIEPGPVIMVTTSDQGKNNVMTISWHMVMDFTPRFALLTGDWNYSYQALTGTKECVLAIPTIDMLDTVISVGTSTGRDMDKFDRFGLTAMNAFEVDAPLIKECYANIECRVADYIEQHNLFVLDGLKAWITLHHPKKHIFHYRGDGTFVADGEEFHRKERMRNRLAPGI